MLDGLSAAFFEMDLEAGKIGLVRDIHSDVSYGIGSLDHLFCSAVNRKSLLSFMTQSEISDG